MSLFKKKQSPQSRQARDQKVKEKECGTDDNCPMCHIPQSAVDQLKKGDNSKGDKNEASGCCK